MYSSSLRLALAQLNPIVGDIAGNAAKARAARAQAQAAGAELVMLPELFLGGYPPEDLVLKPAFQDACRKACEELARETADGGPALLIGLPWREGDTLHNAYALLDGGVVQSVRFKVALPDYGVFDETRVFSPGPLPGPVVFRDKVRLGLPISEDIWSEEVVECLAETGAELLLSPSASPYRRGVGDERMNVAVARVVEAGLPLAYLNQVGGQDEFVFDGASFVLNGDRMLAHQLPAFREALVITGWTREGGHWRCTQGAAAVIETGDEADYAAIVLGLRDYVGKTGCPGIVLELSGGVESSLCAAIAVDALGLERVTCVIVPEGSAGQPSPEELQGRIRIFGVSSASLPIEAPAQAFEAALSGALAGSAGDIVRSLTRKALLRAFADISGSMLLGTGSKSDMACDAAAAHGELAGDYSPLKDVYRTQACLLAALRNRWKPAGALGPDGEVILRDLLLARLPDDDLHDDILDLLIEQEMRVSEIIERGHDAETVKTAARLAQRSEAGRRRAVPGIRIGAAVRGRDRRYPTVNGFRDTGEAPHRPDAALVKGVGRPAADSFDF